MSVQEKTESRMNLDAVDSLKSWSDEGGTYWSEEADRARRRWAYGFLFFAFVWLVQTTMASVGLHRGGDAPLGSIILKLGDAVTIALLTPLGGILILCALVCLATYSILERLDR